MATDVLVSLKKVEEVQNDQYFASQRDIGDIDRDMERR